MLKLSGVLFFISIAFIYSGSAQTTDENNSQKETKESRAKIFGSEPVSFSPRVFEKETKPSEKETFRDLLDKKVVQEDADEPVKYTLRRGEKEWNFEFGYSPFEPTHFTGEKEYNTAGRKLGVAVFRWGRVIGTVKNVTYQYLFEAVPFIISLKNEVVNPDYVSPTATPTIAPTKRETSYGFGVTPATFRFYFLAKNRLKPFIHVGAGFMFTNKAMPLPETSWFNFTGYYGGGLMYQIKRNRAVTLSYRYLHISNASMTRINPGYNANTFALGYSFFYGK